MYTYPMKKVNIDFNKLYSTVEIAQILGISHVAVYKKIKAGLIPARRLGRNYAVIGSDLNEFLNPSNELTENKKRLIEDIVKKVVDEYGETLRKLGKE